MKWLLALCICVCASYMGAAGEIQSIVPRESQSVKIHMQTLRSDGQ